MVNRPSVADFAGIDEAVVTWEVRIYSHHSACGTVGAVGPCWTFTKPGSNSAKHWLYSIISILLECWS